MEKLSLVEEKNTKRNIKKTSKGWKKRINRYSKKLAIVVLQDGT
jgi:hypothetical protein